MKHHEIDAKYTGIVAEYIGKGYTINTPTMHGTQGEIGRIDLTNGDEIVRIMMIRFYERENIGYEIVVGRASENIKPHDPCHDDIIWNNNLDIVYSERFYWIGGDVYGTREQAAHAVAKRRERYARNNEEKEKELSAAVIEIAKRIVRTKLGYTRVNANEIVIGKKYGRYFVLYHDRRYYLR